MTLAMPLYKRGFTRPRQDMIRIGFECALIPNLRELVVAELAIGVADQFATFA
jgi:hypothetical protein